VADDPVLSSDPSGLCSEVMGHSIDSIRTTRTLLGGGPGASEQLPPKGSAADIEIGRTVEGRAELAMQDFVDNVEQFDGQSVSSVTHTVQRYADEAGWTEQPTGSGKMWVDPKGKYQIRLSFAHKEPRLYSSLRGVPARQALRGTAFLKAG